MDENEYNAPTLVSRGRFSETIDFPMYDATNSITLRIPVPDLKRMTYASIENGSGSLGIAHSSGIQNPCRNRQGA